MTFFETKIDGLTIAVTIFWQTGALIVAGLAVARCLRWNAATRHTLLCATLAATLVVPIAHLGCHWSGISWTPAVTSLIHAGAPENPEISPPMALAPAMLEPQADAVEAFRGASYGSILIAVWGIGVVLLSSRLVIGMHRLADIRRRSLLGLDAQTNRVCAKLSERYLLKRPPSVFLSDHVSGPVAVGILNPAILLPHVLVPQLTPSELEDILLHELAHIRRRDPWVLILQKLAAILFWPQPLIYFLNRRLSQAREEVCDNHVLRYSEGVQYGQTLLKLTEYMSPTFALGLDGTWNLEDRISNLLNERRKLVTTSNLLVKCVAVSVAIALTTTLALVSPALAHDDDHQHEPHAQHADHDADEHHTKHFTWFHKDGDEDHQHKKREHIAITSGGDRHVLVTDPETNVSVITVSELDDADLSPSDRQAANKLKEEYEDLQDQQKSISKKLRGLEAKLGELGIRFKKHYSLNVVGGTATAGKSIVLGNHKHPVPVKVRASTLTEAKPVPVTTIARPATPLAPARPTAPRRVVEAKLRSDTDVEERLKRLEALMRDILEQDDSN